MPKQNAHRSSASAPEQDLVYSPTARRFHWLTAALVFIMIPLGVYMSYRGNTLKLWDGTTNNLYSLHKLLGVVVLALVIARLVYRIRNGAPPDEPSLEWWQKAAAHLTHWGLYALLILVPLGGWIGVSLYGARDIFGLFSLPALTAQDQAAAGKVLFLHMLGGMALAAMIAAHFGAAMFHHVIRKDGVLRRMLPGLPRRK
jgi:cytochrome b561